MWEAHITTPSGTPHRNEYPLFVKLAADDRHRRYKLEDNPDEAEIKLIVDASSKDDRKPYGNLKVHPPIERRDSNTFVYIEDDIPVCVYQGLYRSMPGRWFSSRRQRVVPYPQIANSDVFTLIDSAIVNSPSTKLGVFIGRRKQPVRNVILRRNDKRLTIRD